MRFYSFAICCGLWSSPAVKLRQEEVFESDYREKAMINPVVMILRWLAVCLLACLSIGPLSAQQCSSPVNLASNSSFDAGLANFSSGAGWTFNQAFSPSVYDSRAAVQNPSAAPAGNDAAAYPAASVSAFVFNESDNNSGNLSITNPTGNFLTYFNGQLQIWFDMGWRQSFGASDAATLRVQVNGTTFLTITTIGGMGSGSATATLSNGATLGAGTPTTYFNSGGGGALSQWNTIRLIIPYSATTLPNVTWVMTAASSAADDFAIDRIYVPLCQFAQSVVTNTTDSGMGSLRDALVWANAQPGPTSVTFAIPGAGPHTITLSSVLPNVAANGLTIDGTTQPGTQCRDLWTGNSHDLRIEVRGGSGFDGFRLAGANQTVRGLSLTGFANAIFTLSTSSNATIRCNYLGLVPGGTASANARGVWAGGSGARIGGLAAGEGNVISGNSTVGVLTVSGSTDTAVQGNFIGTDPTGMSARANGTGINNLNGTATWREITRNLIAGNNGNAGIMLEADDRISPSTDQVRIQRNRIGFTRDLSGLLRNGGDGIGFMEGSISNVLIGGNASTEGNEITGTGDGIDMRQIANVVVQGNTIARALARGLLMSNVNGATVGGSSGSQANIIGGNGLEGLYVNAGSTNINIIGNQIGAATITGGTFQNQSTGIYIENVSSVTIGNGTAGGRNLISLNGGRAINGVGTTSNVTINGNYVGTDASGNIAVTNGQLETISRRDAVIFENGTFTNINITGNVIGGYTNGLIRFVESSTNGVTINRNSIGIGVDGSSQITSGNNESLVAFGGSTRSYTNVTIGGTGTGEGNIIAYGGQNGVTFNSTQTGAQIIGNTIRNNSGNGVSIISSSNAAIVSNRIFSNGQLGIDLGANGVTLNDVGDGDTGANTLLNFPAITSVNISGTNQLIYGFTFDGPADSNGYRIEFFANSAADASGYGEGEIYLGHVDIVHGGGSQTYSGIMTALVPIGIGSIISATATRKTAGGAWDITSEFSATATAQGIAQLTVALTSTPFDQGSGAAFSTPGSDVSLTATVTNSGSGSTQSNSIFTVISINSTSSFFNSETPAFGGIVRFSSTSPLLTFTPATDLRFSNATTAPAEFAQCTYTPAAGYDPLVRYVCLNPKGSLPHSAPQNQFSVELRARIN